MKQREGFFQEDQENKVSSQEIFLQTEAVSQIVIQAVRLIYDPDCTRCEYESCVYFKQCNVDLTYLLLYIDDMLIAARNEAHIQNLKAQQKKEFDMKDLEEAKKILNIEISQDRSTCRL